MTTARKRLPAFYFLLCMLEGIGVFVLLWTTAPSNASVVSLLKSPLRLSLLSSVIVISILFGVLFYRELRRQPPETGFGDWILARHKELVASFILFILVLVIFWLAVLSPVASPRLSAYFQRWQPLFIWVFLIFFQLYLLGIILRPPSYWIDAGKEFFNQPRMIRSWSLAQIAIIRLDPSWSIVFARLE